MTDTQAPDATVEGLQEAAEFMLALVDEHYGTDHEPDPDNANDTGAWETEAEFRRHRAVIRSAAHEVAEPADSTSTEGGQP